MHATALRAEHARKNAMKFRDLQGPIDRYVEISKMCAIARASQRQSHAISIELWVNDIVLT